MSGLEGRVVLTGATSGIGLATARRLASRSRQLTVQGPEAESAVRPLLDELEQAGAGDLSYVQADFSRLADAATATDRIAERGPIDVLINNAGVPGSDVRRVTADGHERTLQVNFLAMVLLTERLRGSLAAGARIVNVASATHEMASLDLPDIELERGYSAVRAYARSKLAIIMYTRWLARHPAGDAIAVSLQPGVIDTGLLRAMFGSIGANVDRGARSIIHAAEAAAAGGEYFDEETLRSPSAEARDDALGDALLSWTRSALTPFAPDLANR